MSINLTLIGQAIAFAIFVWFCMKYVWPPIIGAIETRKKEVADGLAAADQGKRDLAQAEKRVATMIDEGKQQVLQIIDQAQKNADQMIEKAKVDAQAQAQNIINQAQLQAQSEIKKC